jgi:hypothetical protein
MRMETKSSAKSADLWKLLDPLEVLEVAIVSLSPALHEFHPFPKFELDISLDVSHLLHHSEHLSGQSQ